MYRRETCRLCDQPSLQTALELAPTPVGDEYITAERLNEPQPLYPLTLALCPNCGHSQIYEVIDPDVLYRAYIYHTSDSLGLVDHFRGYADALAGRIKPQRDALAVDIGSNDGTLLRFLKDEGLTVLGVDPARDIAHRATDSGVETLATYFTSELAGQIRRDRGPATIMTANNVFGHADNLADMAEGVKALLADDGVFCFEAFYLADLMRNMVFDFIYHEHLDYHSVKPLSAFFQRHGLELIDIEHVVTKGGSIRGLVQHTGGPRPRSAQVQAYIDREAAEGIQKLSAFQKFRERIDTAKREVVRILDEAQHAGKKIAGYGASVSVTTFIYEFDVARYLEFIVDDNPVRQGRFSPGHHLPVLSPDALYERASGGEVLVLAWRYAEPIIKKHQRYLAEGGKFVVPLPEPRVV